MSWICQTIIRWLTNKHTRLNKFTPVLAVYLLYLFSLVNTYYISLLSQEWAHKQYIAKHQQGPSQQWGNFYYFRMQNIRFVLKISILVSCKSHKKLNVLWASNSIFLVKDGCTSKKGLTIACVWGSSFATVWWLGSKLFTTHPCYYFSLVLSVNGHKLIKVGKTIMKVNGHIIVYSS